MKKNRLEISIAAIFAALVVGLLWSTLGGIMKYLPHVLLALSLAVLVTLVLPFGDKDKQSTDSEKFAPKFFAQALLSSVIGIAIIIGVAALLNRPRFSKSFDLTEKKVNSLSEETVKFLGGLTQEVQIACIPAMDPRENYCGENLHLRNLFAQQSSKITHISVDPGDIATLQRVRPTGYARLVILMKDNRSEVVGKITESNLTNGLINLIKTKKIVYFLAGSGEPSTTTQGERNYAGMVEILKSRAYDVKEHPITDGDIPEEAQLVVAGSTPVPYNAVVENMLRKFLARGGRLILTVNPLRDPGLHTLFEKLAIKLDDKLLLNNRGATPLGAQLAQLAPMRPPLVIGDFSRTSAITSSFSPRDIALAESAVPVVIVSKDKAEGNFSLTHTKLMSAFHAAPVTLNMVERSKIPLTGPMTVKLDANFDSKKMYDVAYQIEIKGAEKLAEGLPAAQVAMADKGGLGQKPAADGGKDKSSEVVVMGFELVGQYEKAAPANASILPLTVAHLYRDKDLISIPNKDFAPRQFDLSKNPGAYLFLFAAFLPIATALTGFYIWMKRRSA